MRRLEWVKPAAVLLVAAHPDDETVGFGITMGTLAHAGWQVRILHVTDGSPRNAELRASLAGYTREQAAQVRRDELRAAVRASGFEDPDTILLPSLGVVDQEAAFAIVPIARQVAQFIETQRPAIVVTHPYEGGHPDHDAVAFAVHAAVRIVRGGGATAIGHAEMTSYHRAGDSVVTGRFRSDGANPPCGRGRTERLDAEGRERKIRMLEAFASQAGVLAQFGAADEPLRCAPAYDFDRPPHAGTLNYERWSFGWTGARVCELMRAARVELGLDT
ncbi:MAG: PIG-L family deacetylase [Polyangiaceae bacterium]|jgi:LmbE family N-acetylglucosaminyl deacetylase